MDGSAVISAAVVMLIAVVVNCSAYIDLGNQHADSQLPADVTEVESRRFGWIVSWLSDRGAMGQFFANMVIAMFVLPPLGPIICSFLENCDVARAHARHIARSLPQYRSRSLESNGVEEILNQIDAAYDLYS